jgi:hypothetical protein
MANRFVLARYLERPQLLTHEWVHSLFFSRVILSNFDKLLEH